MPLAKRFPLPVRCATQKSQQFPPIRNWISLAFPVTQPRKIARQRATSSPRPSRERTKRGQRSSRLPGGGQIVSQSHRSGSYSALQAKEELPEIQKRHYTPYTVWRPTHKSQQSRHFIGLRLNEQGSINLSQLQLQITVSSNRKGVVAQRGVR